MSKEYYTKDGRKIKAWIYVSGKRVPIVEDANTDSPILYRGMSDKYIEDMMNPDTPIVNLQNVHGTGIYFTDDEQEASRYAYSRAARGKTASVLEASLRKGTRIIEEQELISRMKEDYGEWPGSDKMQEWMKKNGYGVMKTKGEGSSSYYVVIDKSVLKWRKQTPYK